MSLLGLDVGAWRCRGLVVSEEGRPLARAHQAYAPEEGRGGQGPEVGALWQAVQEVIRQLAQATRHDPICALSVAGWGEALVPLSPEGAALSPRILVSEARQRPLVQELVARVGAEAWFEITGQVPGHQDALGPLLWLRAHEPELWRATWRLVPVPALVNVLLGGSAACDYTLAGSLLLMEAEHQRWSEVLVRAAGLIQSKLPELRLAGQPIGMIPSRLARELELGGHVQIVLGGRDLPCDALGAGATQAGTGLLHLGASAYLMPVFGALPLRSLMAQQGLSIEPHLVPGLSVSQMVHSSGGRALNWFRDQIIPEEARSAHKRGYNIFERLLAEMPDGPTRLLALPHLGQASPPGGSAGQQGALYGLGLDTTRGEIIRALLEATGYYFAAGQQQIEGLGIALQRYRLTGAGARSERWAQLMADVLGRPLERVPASEAKTLGAAMLAGVGAGLLDPSLRQAAGWAQVERTFEPDLARHQTYNAHLARYCELMAQHPPR